MELTKQVVQFMNDGFPSFIIDTSKTIRWGKCRRCKSIENRDQKFVSIHDKPCMGGCGFGKKGNIPRYTVEDLVPVTSQCGNCGSLKGFDFPEDSGVEKAEQNNHEMYGKGKASMLEENGPEDHDHILENVENEFSDEIGKQFEASWTETSVNEPAVKGEVEEQVYTIEPPAGFEMARFSNGSEMIEDDSNHNNMIQQSCYAHLVNPGETPHMQKKIPIDTLLGIRKSSAKGMINIWEPKTYGSRLINEECKSKMGFSPEYMNQGNRKLSDQTIHRILTDINFKTDEIKSLCEKFEHIDKKSKAGKEILKQIENLEEKIGDRTYVLKTGQNILGQNKTVYDVRINRYDQVKLEKLQLELDVKCEEPLMDIRKIFKDVKTRKNKAKAAKAAATRKRNIAAKRKATKKNAPKKKAPKKKATKKKVSKK